MKQKLNFFLLLILILSVVLIVLSCSLYFFSGGNIPFDYGVAIDAGSSKTKFFLYDWSSAKTNETGYVKEKATQKLEMPIDEYADRLPELTKNLAATLSSISSNIEYTRKDYRIPIFLGATAGMRLLRAVNEGDSKKILDEIYNRFDQYTESQKRFQVNKEDVKIISGDKEGLYCWISVNYIMGFVPPESRVKGTVGILDMGGASAQIAFQTPDEDDEKDKLKPRSSLLKANEKTRLFGTDYNIYTHSNLCYGNDASRRRYQYIVISKSGFRKEVTDPCTHPGQLDRTITKEKLLEDACTNNDDTRKLLTEESYTFKAKPDIKACQEFTSMLVNKNYVEKNFPLAGNDPKNNDNFEIIPAAPPAETTFYALATYYYSISQLKKADEIRFESEEALRKEIDSFCNREWATIVKGKTEREIEYMHNYCFALNYVFNTLKIVYKFSDKQFNKIEFREKLDGHDLGWSLGYMLEATNSIPEGGPEERILNKPQFISLSVLGLILFLGVLFVFLKSKVYPKGNRDRNDKIEI